MLTEAVSPPQVKMRHSRSSKSSSDRRRPDFFIVGAPRSGTTAMFHYLSSHPDVYMSDRKEMHFFGRDLNFGPQIYRRTLEAYLAEYEGRNGERRAGEASVWYLLSKTTANEIKEFNPDANIIIMLRDPTELLHSMYYMFRYDGNEHLLSFEEALRAENLRRAGQLTTRQTYFAQGLVYREIVRFTEQVQRYFDAFGRERVHIIIYDDFAGDTAGTYRKALEFLDVDSTGVATDFNVINGNRTVKSSALQFVLNDGLVRRAAVALQPMLSRPFFVLLRTMREKWMRSNLHFEKRPTLSPELKAKLKREFAPEILRLSELLGRDLTHWSKS
jgi:hypothetical protein